MQKIVVMVFLVTFLNSTNVFSASPIPVTSKNGMVSSAQYLATKVGSDILSKGGNAIDAAVAVGYALAVVEPQCGNIGGGGFMLVHTKNNENIFLDFREKSPSELTYDKFHNALFEKTPIQSKNPYLTSGIPGTVMGLNTALEKYGTMTLSEVIQPAIVLAKEGFPVDQTMIGRIQSHIDDFRAQKNISSIFLIKGQLYPVGSILKQTNLAKTLTEISSKGNYSFYQDNIAQKIILSNKLNNGIFTLQDLKNYKVDIRNPTSCQYHGYTIVTGAPPSSGVTVCEILKVANKFIYPENEFHSSSEIDRNAEIMTYSYNDRNQYLGSYDRSIKKANWMLSDEHINSIYAEIRSNKKKKKSTDFHTNNEKLETTHYSIIDKWGNAASVTYTLNGYFGNNTMPSDTGFFMNNEMLDFSSDNNGPNSLAPNKRPLSSISPVFIMKGDTVLYALGTPGGVTIMSQMTEVIQNLIDYHMNISQAVDSCRYHIGKSKVIYEEPYCFSKDTINVLTKMGYQVKTGLDFYHEDYWGAVAAVEFDPESQMYYGAMDVRRPSGAAIGPTI